MSDDPFRTVLYAIGSLPFWTGERKLKQFLRGTTGSFWGSTEPLKPTYLKHHFFGALDDRDDGALTRALQRLKGSGYLKKERLSSNLPHQVIKLTGKGVLKYYNFLVTDQELTNPAWRLHHVAQLQRQPKRPITTGGELLEFSSDPHLTQTPGFVDQESRIKDEATIRLVGDTSNVKDAQSGQALLLRAVLPQVDEGLTLGVGEPTDVRSIPASDLRRKLTHFSAREQHPAEDNPYVLKGTLEEQRTLDNENALSLRLSSDRGKVRLRVPREMIDPDLGLSEGSEYVVGPVKRREAEGEELTLKQRGEIQPHKPFQ